MYIKSESNYALKYKKREYLSKKWYKKRETLYEIYVSFGIMFGIVYVKKEATNEIFYEIKVKIEEEYVKNKEPSDKCRSGFDRKYGLSLSNDLFFDMDGLF